MFFNDNKIDFFKIYNKSEDIRKKSLLRTQVRLLRIRRKSMAVKRNRERDRKLSMILQLLRTLNKGFIYKVVVPPYSCIVEFSHFTTYDNNSHNYPYLVCYFLAYRKYLDMRETSFLYGLPEIKITEIERFKLLKVDELLNELVSQSYIFSSLWKDRILKKSIIRNILSGNWNESRGEYVAPLKFKTEPNLSWRKFLC